LKRPDLGAKVEKAVVATLAEIRTPDLGGTATTEEVTNAVLRRLG